MVRRHDRNRTPDSGKPRFLTLEELACDPRFSPEIRAGAAAALRYDQRVAAKRERDRAVWKQIEEDFTKIRDQVPAFTPSQKHREIMEQINQDFKDTIAKDSRPTRPSRWPGRKQEWLLGHGAWRGAFVEYPKRPQEPIWAPRRPDDYCRRIVREAEKVGLFMSAWTVKRPYPSRPNKPLNHAKPSK
jgi:hypothetical protein